MRRSSGLKLNPSWSEETMVWSLAPSVRRQSSDGKLKSRKIVQFWRRLPAWGLTMPDWLLQNLTSSLLWEIVLIAGGAAALAYLKKKWPIPGRPVPLRFLNTTDSLRIVAGAAKRPALFPQLFPIPDLVHHLFRRRESKRSVGFLGVWPDPESGSEQPVWRKLAAPWPCCIASSGHLQ